MSTQPTGASSTHRRRRKQGNPLLGKIVGVVIAVHIVLLPIAAKFGAFKAVERHFVDVQMVNLPPQEKVKTPPKTAAHKAPTKVARRGPAAASHHAAPAHSNLSQPKVVAGPVTPGNGDGGPTVDANGTGPAGALPTVAAAPTPKTAPVSAPTPAPAVPTPAPVVVVPPVRPVAPTPPPATPPPHVPIYTDAEPTDAPKPVLPDTLRTEALDATAVAEFTVGPDGSPTDVRIVTSAGNRELDRLVLDAAKRWRFKPAQRDGQPVASVVRLHVEFQVI